MIWLWLIPLFVIAACVGFYFIGRNLRTFGGQVQVERAQEMFRLQRAGLQGEFLQAAAKTGKPRGLFWKECQWEEQALFVRDKNNGQIAALVGVTIQFEAVPGSDMEGLPAVGNLRNGSAVFYFHKGHWGTVGRTVFNMNPNEAIEHFKNQYERIV